MLSQNEQILNYLRTGKGLTQLEALNYFGCFRLASRISDLRRKGHIIRMEWMTEIKPDGTEKRFARYWLESEATA